MKKHLSILAALAVIFSAFVAFAAGPQVIDAYFLMADGAKATNTVTFTVGASGIVKMYSSATDIALDTVSYTNAAQRMVYPKFATTTEADRSYIGTANGVVTLKLIAANTNHLYIVTY